jgi:hypothetical protein
MSIFRKKESRESGYQSTDAALSQAGSLVPGDASEYYSPNFSPDGTVNLNADDGLFQGVTPLVPPGFLDPITGNDLPPVPPVLGGPMMPHIQAAQRPTKSWEELARCRANHPFVEIIEYPRVTSNVLLVAPGTAYDIDLLAETEAVRIVATGQIWVSVNGAASYGGEDCQLVSFDTGNYWFVPGVNRISVVSSTPNVYVSAHCLLKRA